MENYFNRYGNKLNYGNNKPMVETVTDDEDDFVGKLTPNIEDTHNVILHNKHPSHLDHPG